MAENNEAGELVNRNMVAEYVRVLIAALDARIERTGELDVPLANRIEHLLWPKPAPLSEHGKD